MLPIVILALVFILIAVRQVGGIKLQIWQVMLFGALAVLLAGQVSISAAIASINLDVMVFLFGMFIVGQALEESGYLTHISCRILRHARTMDGLLLMILFGAGIASAFLMNDTLAIIGTPLMLHLASQYGINPKALLLSLAFAVTVGSVMSPIGNPQNLLIAVSGSMENPFLAFFSHLLLPTMLNLLICFFMIKHFYKGDFKAGIISHPEGHIRDKSLARLCGISLSLILLMVLAKIALVFLAPSLDFRLTYIALVAALPIVAISPKRFRIVKGADWPTLVFFAAMFVLMESVWESGFFQFVLEGTGADITSLAMVLAVSVILSQFISNVPLVALYLPMLMHSGASAGSLVALAAGSTIAGNLTILGAASNVIIIQNAESKSGQTLSFVEFAKIGIPLTILNVLIYWLFLSFL